MKNIYVICPPFFKSGGPELLHQLSFEINKMGPNMSYMAYPRSEKYDLDSSTNPFFKKYVKKDGTIFLEDVEDHEDNILIFPETMTKLAYKFKKAKIYIWWLSVDNYYNQFGKFKRLFLSKRLPKIMSKYAHLSQSAYSTDFLKNNNLESLKLSDYINTDFMNVSNSQKRENIVLYNPKKGFKFTAELIKSNPLIKFMPLINMDNNQLKDAMQRAKVYIDFGNHPGKDRIPREAALNGCVIITGLDGSAKYFDDVRISDDFKFEKDEKSLSHISKKIHAIFNDFDQYSEKMEQYRVFIKNEHNIFIDDIKHLLNSINL